MPTNPPPPIEPSLHRVVQQLELEPGPIVPEDSLQDVTLRVDAAWAAFAYRLVDRSVKPADKPPHHVERVRRSGTTVRSWVGVAVAVLCVIGVIGISVSRSGPEHFTTHYQTIGGQISRVTLPNGTMMTLAPATSVTVSGTKGGAAVDVVGEAYFSVAQSSTHPLVVRTSNTIVQVLGTAFSVRRYTDETRTRVVVEDGKVAVRAKRYGTANDTPTTMTARMMAQVSDSGVSVTPISDTRTLTGWRDGMLVFNDALVRDVVAEIARCYNAVIRVEGNSLANERLVLEVPVRRTSLSQVLNLVSLAVNAHVRRDGDAFVLVPGRDVATPKVQRQQSLPQPEKLYGR